MPCSYKIYIGLAKFTASQATSSPTAFDIFTSPDSTASCRFLAPLLDRRKPNPRKSSRALEHHRHFASWLKRFDYRFGRLQIEWWHIGTAVPHEPAEGKSMMSDKQTERRQRGLLGVFEPLPECSATCQVGILRLYRSDTKDQRTLSDTSKQPEDAPHNDQCAGTVLAVLAVPGYMTPTDFLSFAGPFASNIDHVRVVRDDSPNHYMILLKFRDQPNADDFYSYYNGKTFSPLEPEICHIVYVSSVECELRDIRPSDINEESRLVCARPAELFLQLDGKAREEQLPTCPVCLERLDCSVSGLLTTLCRHTFHCRCLARWGDGNCPVCRYTHTSPFVDQDRFHQTMAGVDRLNLDSSMDGGSAVPQQTYPGSPALTVSSKSSAAPASIANPLAAQVGVASQKSSNQTSSIQATQSTAEPQSQQSHSSCHGCGLTTDLWVCLICGTIGCGRYANGHAKSHFERTQHPYSMELKSQRVWDYTGDGYVHRLLQNMADRKVIALDTYGGPESMAGTSHGAGTQEPGNGSSLQHPTATNSTGTSRLGLVSYSGGGSSSARNHAQDADLQSGYYDEYEDGYMLAKTERQYAQPRYQQSSSFVDAREKLEAVTQEYEALLTSQLESQREHYEIQIARLQHQLAQPRQKPELEHKHQALQQKYTTMEATFQSREKHLEELVAELTSKVEEERKEWTAERRRLEASATKWLKKSTEDTKSLLEERALVEQLMENQGSLKSQITELNSGMRDLEEQVRDLSFFISTQKAISKEGGENIEGASVVGVASAPPKNKGKRRTLPRK
ncbi:hypothetical protein GGI25_001633 [Coemansia spiralis]|uniref:Zf-UBP-domain-containing protein n=2 Tax=Coemansia TaxID=4863 RepID=A0A9W8KY94_9FUNG|nr:BRCA1-associated protein 2-domain-containing protein [Coemansia spiralis]KAJ1991574.1 hypothetical protein EDC05_003339 [Coemansia umbellata]KAJ2623935.1 hypothetical protein GGI26_001950 [Coemansia sp. RSA 1358]KAJ2679277.1 hypothetical protein GGI25_001633 [Coemansia spiralis]